jgi:outer membrane protein
MKGISKYFFTVVVMAGCLTLNAQDSTYTLTLQEAREYALQHNKTLLNARDQITSSKKKVYESIANGLPQVEGSLDYTTYFNYEMNFSYGSSSGGTIPDFTQPPYDAGDAALFGDIMSLMGSSEPIIMTDQFSGNIQVSQLIFSGQFIAGIQTAKIARRLADQSLVISELDVKENITNSYYNILTNEHSLNVISKNLENLDAIIKNTENLYSTGMLDETAVLELKVRASGVKNLQKILERLNQLNNNMLKFQLGIAPGTNIVLADSLPQIIESLNPQAALVNNYDVNTDITYQLMESQVALTKKQVDIQEWAYAPTAAGFYRYTEKFKTTGFDMTPNHLAGVTVSVPIFSSGMRNSKVSQAKISLDMSQRQQEMIKDQLEIQYSGLLYNYENALENFNTQKENIDVAERVYTIKKNKYKQGMLTSTELALADSDYLTAESDYMSAVLSLLQAQTSLDKLYNRL